MSTYAAQADVEAYIEGWVTDDPIALERLIQRAEREVDRLIFPINVASAPTQVISLGGASGGTFTVAFKGAVTSPQMYGEPGSQLATTLQGLVTIGPGNVTVLGSNPYTLVWERGWAENTFTNYRIPEVTVDGSSLTGTPNVEVVVVPGRKVNPLVDLNENQALALAYATCAQVEFRNAMGEDYFVRPQFDSVKGPDFTTAGRLPMIGPKVKRELSGTGLILKGGRAVAGAGRRGVGKGWPTY